MLRPGRLAHSDDSELSLVKLAVVWADQLHQAESGNCAEVLALWCAANAILSSVYHRRDGAMLSLKASRWLHIKVAQAEYLAKVHERGGSAHSMPMMVCGEWRMEQ